MVQSQTIESVSESACQFTPAVHINMDLTQEASLSTSSYSLTSVSVCSSNQRISAVHDCCMKKEMKCDPCCQDSVIVPAQTYLLFPPLLPLVLSVLQHLLPPQVKEVGWIGVELQALLSIVSASGQHKSKRFCYLLADY